MAGNHPASIGSEIPDAPDTVANPVIIFKEIDLIWDAANSKLNIAYFPPLPRPTMPIDQFIDQEARRATTRGGQVADPASPLDLNCREEAYIVFKLASDRNWQFTPDGAGFTTKADEGGRYFNLVHATFDTATQTVIRYRGGEPTGDGCRLLYFRAKGSPMGYRDGFNLIVQLILDSTNPPLIRRTMLVIDPDVRHPGGAP